MSTPDIRAAQAALQSDTDIFVPHPRAEVIPFGPLSDIPAVLHPPGAPPGQDPVMPLPGAVIASPPNPLPDFPGASRWSPQAAKLSAATEEELELQRAYPNKTWDEIIALLLNDSASELVAAGQYCKEIDAVSAEATKLSTAAEAMFEQESAMRREFGRRIEQAKAKRDKALRLIRRGR